MKIDPKSSTFSVLYGFCMAFIAYLFSSLFDSTVSKLIVFFALYLGGFAFAIEMGWTVLEYRTSSSPNNEEIEE